MKHKYYILIPFGMFLLAYLAISSLKEHNNFENPDIHKTATENHAKPSIAEDKRINLKPRSRETREPTESEIVNRLTELKLRWGALNPIDEPSLMSQTEQELRISLALESIELLRFSKEMFDLQEYLIANRIPISTGNGSLSTHLIEFLRKGSFNVTNQEIFEFVELNPILLNDQNVSVTLAFVAGEATKSIKELADFEDFRYYLASKAPSVAQEAEIAFYSHKAISGEANFEETLNKLLNLSESEPGSPTSRIAPRSFIGKYLTTLNSFNEISIIADVTQNTQGFSDADRADIEKSIVLRMAGLDSDATVDLVINNPDRYDPTAMRDVGALGFDSRMHTQGVEAALEWLHRIPEGPHRNNAILGAYYSNYEGDKELGKKILSMIPPAEQNQLIQGY